MLHHTHLVVNLSPQDSPPDVATSSSDLRIGRILSSERTQQHWTAPTFEVVRNRETLFSFAVGSDIEATSQKSALEICWETCERIQWLERRLDVFPSDLEYLHRKTTAFRYFLIRVAGIAGSDVAASIAMGPPRLVDTPGADYLIRSFKDVSLPRLFGEISPEAREAFKKRFLSDKEKRVLPYIPGIEAKYHLRNVEKIAQPAIVGEDVTDEQVKPVTLNLIYDASLSSEAGSQTPIEVPFGPLEERIAKSGCPTNCLWAFGKLLEKPTYKPIEVTPKEYAARRCHVNDDAVTVPHLPNLCPSCRMWVTVLHDDAQCPAKITRKLAVAYRKEKEKRIRERKPYRAHIARTLAPYLGAVRERNILAAQGTVAQAQVEQIDARMVRKLSKQRDTETGRKRGMKKARELWSEVTKESVCQQHPLLEHRVAN